MPFRKCPEGGVRWRSSSRFRSGGIIAALAAILALTAVAQSGQPTPQRNSKQSCLSSDANRPPDANDQMLMREQQEQDQNFENANAARRKLLTDESAQLLALAAQLKIEMDKTDKDTLSLGVIRKAEQIEKLAKDVKAHMKLTIGQG